ncbi:MAG: DUF58 domain-containing protein [Pseudomonadota bacterium]
MSGTQRRNAAAGLVEPAVLAQVDRLELVARQVVAGMMSGMHRSSTVGASTEFAEHRMYTPGDDIRRIDWRVYGRTDRLFVKTFQAETNMDVMAIVDCSASMGFETGGVTKLRYALMLAACFGHLADAQRDRFGAALVNEQVVSLRRPRAVQDEGLMRMLESAQANGSTNLGLALEALTDQLKRRALIVLVSDLYMPPQDAVSAIAPLLERGHELSIFHILDPGEQELDFAEAGIVEDSETGVRIPLDPVAANRMLRTRVEQHIRGLEQALTARRVDYSFGDTAVPLAERLRHYVARRRRAQVKQAPR